MIVVDRSGSVQRSQTAGIIQRALARFVESTSSGGPVFEENRDIIGLGSFGASWKLDFAPSSIFRSGTATLARAIQAIPFEAGATNTSEGLYQAYEQIRKLNRTESINVILLLTDGRPNAFTARFDGPSTCQLMPPQIGVIAASVGASWPPLPPRVYGENNVYTLGLFKPLWTGWDFTFVDNGGCHFSTELGQIVPGGSFYKDFPDLGDTEVDARGNSIFGPLHGLEDRSTSNPRSIRFASINAADNMATAIRKDRVLRPTLLVVGLRQNSSGEESIDSFWLARVANDLAAVDSTNKPLLQVDQTPGRYFEAGTETLGNALQKAASDIALLATIRGKRLPDKNISQ